MINIARITEDYGYKTYVSYGDCRRARKRTVENEIIIGNRYGRNLSLRFGRLFGGIDCGVPIATYRFLKQLEALQPDLIHLHNLHGTFIHVGMLFDYIKKHHIPVVWTLHDCWAVTAQCPHFTLVKCDKWKTACGDCPQYMKYPKTYFDYTTWMYREKKKWFSSVEKMTVVMPSEWLTSIVGESFLHMYNRRVIYNGINLELFQPTESSFLQMHGLMGKKIILGVADVWSERKGIADFCELAEKIEEDTHIVMVGLNQEQINAVSRKNLLALPHTTGIMELVKIYSASTVFFNPTYEETFGLVNIEAMACGIPVVTYRTGGSPEALTEETGKVIDFRDYVALTDFTMRAAEARVDYRSACISRAAQFSATDRFREYVALYEEILK